MGVMPRGTRRACLALTPIQAPIKACGPNLRYPSPIKGEGRFVYRVSSRTKSISPVWRKRRMRSASRIILTLPKQASMSSLMTT
jgi:hypothetical protein